MSDEFIARASVPTDNAARYVKQLASHLGRRAEVRDQAGGTRIVLDGGDCLLVASSDTIQLQATAATVEGLDRVTDVVGSHLERFGQRNELAVSWQRS